MAKHKKWYQKHFSSILTEYDEKKHMRAIYQEGYEAGKLAGYSKSMQARYSKGELTEYSREEYDFLEMQVQKKLLRGKSPALIAEELETNQDLIEKIIDHILQH